MTLGERTVSLQTEPPRRRAAAVGCECKTITRPHDAANKNHHNKLKCYNIIHFKHLSVAALVFEQHLEDELKYSSVCLDGFV